SATARWSGVEYGSTGPPAGVINGGGAGGGMIYSRAWRRLCRPSPPSHCAGGESHAAASGDAVGRRRYLVPPPPFSQPPLSPSRRPARPAVCVCVRVCSRLEVEMAEVGGSTRCWGVEGEGAGPG